MAAPFDFRHVLLQPTTGCNLNCTYCYLPDRKDARPMSVAVAESIARSLAPVPHLVWLLWHGGEPLATGLGHFRRLIDRFEELRERGRVRHSLQTNGTLITSEWCEFFKEKGLNIGISLDGPAHLNTSRVNWSSRSSHNAALRGIDLLRVAGLNFSVIAVVGAHNIRYPRELYSFFRELGCRGLNINIEEHEGLNQGAQSLQEADVRFFWEELYAAWRQDPTLRIREFDSVIGWMTGVCEPARAVSRIGDFWPTIAFNGDVVVLSPELLGAPRPDRDRFIIGNVLDRPLPDIIRGCLDVDYVQEYFSGRHQCMHECPYYSYCGGGEPSNKYFELGRLDVTETAHCRNTRQVVVDVVLASLDESASTKETANA